MIVLQLLAPMENQLLVKFYMKYFLSQKFDVRLVGNIGNPILSAKNVKKKTIFVVEASSYQLEYSKIFRSKYSVILNISADHIERSWKLSTNM